MLWAPDRDEEPLPRDFVGSKAAQDLWLWDKVEGWRDSVATLSGVARRHPQTAYMVLQKSLQQEWAFVQCVAPEIRMDFQVVEVALRDIFLSTLFQGAVAQIPGRAITGLPVEQAGITLPDPTWTAGANWTTSCVITGHLVTVLHGTA